MAYKNKQIELPDFMSDKDIEEFKKVAGIVAQIGEQYPAISIDILARVIIISAIQYEMTKDDLKEFIKCLTQYVEVSEGLSDKFNELYKETPKTIH